MTIYIVVTIHIQFFCTVSYLSCNKI